MGYSQMFKTEGLSFVKTDLYDAVGVGDATAKTILSKLWIPAPVHEILNLAAYTIQEVKGSVDGCGLGTDIMFLRHGLSNPVLTSLERVEPEEVHKMEELFRLYRKVERNNFHDCVGHPGSVHTSDMIRRVEEYRTRIKSGFRQLFDERTARFHPRPSTSETSAPEP
jgi:hypothetical protein